jgi:hypothetical protein
MNITRISPYSPNSGDAKAVGGSPIRSSDRRKAIYAPISEIIGRDGEEAFEHRVQRMRTNQEAIGQSA